MSNYDDNDDGEDNDGGDNVLPIWYQLQLFFILGVE